ncbi:serine/threonine-protein kinase [Nonomuraea sp. NPDC059194]|uniref:serine/threonine-protein kinase n=1 Tax=Nonomuraea sp. NPDC059194 TaxID=3346764 RepID=UPI0036879068
MTTNPRPLRPSDPVQMASYRLTGLLGEGGQGTVYLGVAPSGEQVAVKVLHARLVQDNDSRRRFMREVRAARTVGSFGTARILDVDIEGDQPYIVSEYIAGDSLQELITREGARDVGGMKRLMLATAAALQAIHQAGIVHRDFKPSNVLLALDGPRVVDFGIARALEATTMLSSAIVGTPPYMSPEQLGGREIGPKSDVFSWAVTMVFAATGRPAFGQDSIPAVFNRILTVQPDLDGVPEELRGLLVSCLAKEPESRPCVDQVLQHLVGGRPEPAPPHRPPTPQPQVLQVPQSRASGGRVPTSRGAGAEAPQGRSIGLAVAAQFVVMLATAVTGFAIYDNSFARSEIAGEAIPFWLGMGVWPVTGIFVVLALRSAAKRG